MTVAAGDGAGPRRLGIYVDAVLHADGPAGDVVAEPADLGFLLFASEVGRHFDATVLFGRTAAGPPPPGSRPVPGAELAPLPHYPDLRHLASVARAAAGTLVAFGRGLARVDVVWVFGPHPFGLALVALALLRRKRVVLGVRQDTVRYYRSRLPSRRWLPAVLPAWALDGLHRLVARRVGVTVVGEHLARRYRGDRRRVLAMTVSSVRAADVASAPVRADWSAPVELVTAGRLEPEKSPFVLVDALGLLERRDPGRFRLTWLGTGRLEGAVRRRAAAAGVSDRVDLRGFVSPTELPSWYRRAHAFVHVSLTEGVPQVVVEAMACGVPVVATDVGGVAAAVDGGRAAVLIHPGDPDAVADAVLRLAGDAGLRETLARRGLELAREAAPEVQAERIARFLGGAR